MSNCKRFLALLIMAMLVVSVLGMVGFAAETGAAVEPECYEHGDVNGDGSINGKDAIRILYASMYGTEKYPVTQDLNFNGAEGITREDAIYVLYASMNNKDYQLKGTIHAYYDPSWSWSETTNGMTAAVSFKCGCGKTHTISAEGVTVNAKAVQPTCTENGSVTYTAEVVFEGKTYTSEAYVVAIAATGHTMVGEQSCTTASTCACGYTLPALGHDMQKDETRSTAADCDTGSVEVYNCSRCDHAQTYENDNALGHTYVYVADGDESLGDCKYLKHYKCSVCGADKEAVEADYYYVHNYTAKLTQEATCSATGVKTFTCTCGDSYTETVPTNDSHDWVAGEPVDGVTTHTCSWCSATKTTVSAVDHAVSAEALSSVDEVQLKNDTAISLDEETVNALDAEQKITISVEPVAKDSVVTDETVLAQIGGDHVYDFNMAYEDGTPVSDFGGTVTITLPYELQTGDDVDNINVWFINDKGDLEAIKGTYSNGYVTFTTDHFSYYTVTRLTAEQRCALYGHDTITREKAATCTEDGYKLVVCRRCGEVESEETFKASSHNYGTDEVNSKAADCVNAGVSIEVCANCEHSVTTNLPALGHDMKETENVAATCQASGKIVMECANGCGHKTEEILTQLSHNFTQEVQVADCTNKGFKKNTCSICGEVVVEEETAPIGHVYNAEDALWVWSEDRQSASVTLVCDHNAEHKVELNAVISTSSSSTSCATVYTATASYNKTNYTNSVQGPTHNPASTWSSNATQHYHQCQTCNEKMDAANHNWGTTKVTKAATCSDSGTSVTACTVCGYEKTETIPSTGVHTYVNGVCSVCGHRENDCYHVRMHVNKLDLSAYNICEGAVIEEMLCDCGEQGYAMWNFNCKFESSTREETRADGTKKIVNVDTCTACGLVIESAYYNEITVDPCQVQGVSWYKVSLNGTVISENVQKSRYDAYNHPDTVLVKTEKLTMETHGICGVELEYWTCPCGEQIRIEPYNTCSWSYNSEESQGNTSVYDCSTCGAKRTILWTYEEKPEECATIEHGVFTYLPITRRMAPRFTSTKRSITMIATLVRSTTMRWMARPVRTASWSPIDVSTAAIPGRTTGASICLLR